MLDELIKESCLAHKEMKIDARDGAEYRWLNKKVYATKPIFNGESLENISLSGIGKLEPSNEQQHLGQRSLLLTTDTNIEDIRPRPHSSVQITLPKENWSDFNRISLWVYPEATGFQNFYFHFAIFNNNGGNAVHAPSLIPNKWNHVVWEINHIERNEIIRMSLGPVLLGCPPEAKPQLRVFFSNLELQKVDPEYEEGWNLGGRIAYCHSGYFCGAQKVALVQDIKSDIFEIFDETGNKVYQNKPINVITSLGTFYRLDFTCVNKPGHYYLKVDEKVTPLFDINEDPYEESIWKSINFLRMLRCGDDIEGVHSPCHLNCYTTHWDGRLLPNHGGWHDAGDVSQFEICTAEMAHAIVELAERLKTKNALLSERLLEEARYGLNWLLRTRFGDGFRALAVHYSIWRKNIMSSSKAFNPQPDAPGANVAENGAFENFLAAAAEACAARVFMEKDKIFADWCLRSAKEDFAFAVEGLEKGYYTRRWGIIPEAQIGGAAALAAAELYEITKEEAYLNKGDLFAEMVLACQQTEYTNWKWPIRGFFYENKDHAQMLIYEHRGHEQSPIHGLVRLCEVAPNHPHVKKWKQGLELYAEYVTETIDKAEPYALMPAHVYDVNKINIERITIPTTWGTKEEGMKDLIRQVRSGIPLDKDVYLRIFPIAIQRRGFHATLLSKAKAVSAIARVLDRDDLKQIAINQLEWILGKNPFASSTMYGEGHNYHPLYVAFSPQLVGSLPVGIKTLNEHDAPYWPVINNAVYKEVWGHTTGKYLWVLADLV